MTIVSTAPSAQSDSLDITSAIVDDFSDSQSDIMMMIGIGLVKKSDAVYFKYVGAKDYVALTNRVTGEPISRLGNIRLVGIDVAKDIGEFKSTKLNLVIESARGFKILVTSGLTTCWSQCVITSLMGLYNTEELTKPFNLDTWKGDSKMRPCFAAIRVGKQKVTDQGMYDQLAELRSDRADDKIEELMLQAVEILKVSVAEDYAIDNVVVEEIVEESDTTSDKADY